ncbi:MAG: hypothetical protein JOZ02_16980 [Acidobacteria bacterium]|nr:hypothetical protein [Acidobacteriota bacterium]
MAKRDMRKALGASLKAEERAVSSRFEKSATVLGKKEPAPRAQPEPVETGEVVSNSLAVRDGDAELISRIKRRCMKAGISADDGEVLRAGLNALDVMNDRKLARCFEGTRQVKTGEPGRETPAFIVRRAYAVNLRSPLRGTPSRFERRVIILYRSS